MLSNVFLRLIQYYSDRKCSRIVNFVNTPSQSPLACSPLLDRHLPASLTGNEQFIISPLCLRIHYTYVKVTKECCCDFSQFETCEVPAWTIVVAEAELR